MLKILVQWILHKTPNRLLQHHRRVQLDLCIFGALSPILHSSNDICPSVRRHELSPPDGHTICLPLLDICIDSWTLRDWPQLPLWDVSRCAAVVLSRSSPCSLRPCLDTSVSQDCEVRVLHVVIIISLSPLDLFCCHWSRASWPQRPLLDLHTLAIWTWPLMVLRFSGVPHYPVSRVHLGATTFPSRIRVVGYSAVQQLSPLRRDPPASRKYLFSTHDHGRLRSNQAGYSHLPGPYVGLTVHWAVSSL